MPVVIDQRPGSAWIPFWSVRQCADPSRRDLVDTTGGLPMAFTRSAVLPAPAPTLGVEEEFLVVEPGTGALMPVGPSVVTAARLLGADLQPELTPVQVET